MFFGLFVELSCTKASVKVLAILIVISDAIFLNGLLTISIIRFASTFTSLLSVLDESFNLFLISFLLFFVFVSDEDDVRSSARSKNLLMYFLSCFKCVASFSAVMLEHKEGEANLSKFFEIKFFEMEFLEFFF